MDISINKSKEDFFKSSFNFKRVIDLAKHSRQIVLMRIHAITETAFFYLVHV